jgi:hypothetical protein
MSREKHVKDGDEQSSKTNEQIGKTHKTLRGLDHKDYGCNSCANTLTK